MIAAARLALLDLLLYEGQLYKCKNLNSDSPQRREVDGLASQVRMIRIVTSNQGNGDSKTTTAATIAKDFSEQGKRVVIIDTDRQGVISTILIQLCHRGVEV
jgi:Mrp family chromosome partitioning ATPase